MNLQGEHYIRHPDDIVILVVGKKSEILDQLKSLSLGEIIRNTTAQGLNFFPRALERSFEIILILKALC